MCLLYCTFWFHTKGGSLIQKSYLFYTNPLVLQFDNARTSCWGIVHVSARLHSTIICIFQLTACNPNVTTAQGQSLLIFWNSQIEHTIAEFWAHLCNAFIHSYTSIINWNQSILPNATTITKTKNCNETHPFFSIILLSSRTTYSKTKPAYDSDFFCDCAVSSMTV